MSLAIGTGKYTDFILEIEGMMSKNDAKRPERYIFKTHNIVHYLSKVARNIKALS